MMPDTSKAVWWHVYSGSKLLGRISAKDALTAKEKVRKSYLGKWDERRIRVTKG